MQIAVIGCGVMGSAFARHFSKKQSVLLYDRNRSKTEALAAEIKARAESDIKGAVTQADVIFLAVKPKDLSALTKEVKGLCFQGKIVMSVLTGSSVELLKHYFPQAQIVRLMPNLGIVYEKGVIGLVEHLELSLETKQTVDVLIEGIGTNLWLPESKIDALIALSGSGIGFALVMIEAMIDGGIFLGFNVSQSREIVLETLLGAIALVQYSKKHPAELKQQICSPGGTTIAGLKVMEEQKVRAGIFSTLNACYEKALDITSKMEREGGRV